MSRKVPPVHYTIGPVLSSKAPIGRSRFLVFAVALGFLGLAGRAAYIQVWKQDFLFKKAKCVMPERQNCPLTVAVFWSGMDKFWLLVLPPKVHGCKWMSLHPMQSNY